MAVTMAITMSTILPTGFISKAVAVDFVMPNPASSPAAKKSLGGQSVSFNVHGEKIAANLYLPASYDSRKRYSAVVVVAPQGGLKEQTAGIYAKKLAEQGFIAIAFDHRTYGQSGGEPRQTENPYWKAEDIKGAVDYLLTLPNLADSKVGLLALCSGAGYGVLAAVNDSRIDAFATVSGVFDFREREAGLDGINPPSEMQKERFQTLMNKSAEARQKYVETGIMDYTQLVPDLTSSTSDFWKQGYDYYRTERGFIDGWENKRSAISIEARLSVNTSFMLPQLNDLGTPFLAVAGTEAFTYPFSVAAVERAEGKKNLFKVEGATHFDLYDNPKYLDPVTKQLNAFFTSAFVTK